MHIPAQGPPVSIGRDPSCTIVLADSCLISKRHAELSRSPHAPFQLYILDPGSRNGIYVNQTRLPSGVKTELKLDDVVTFSKSSLDFPYRVKPDPSADVHSQLAASERKLAELKLKLIKLRDKLEDALECPICFDLREDIVAVECGHPVCRPCWNKIVAQSSKQALCPTCRHPCRRPPVSSHFLVPAVAALAQLRSDPDLGMPPEPTRKALRLISPTPQPPQPAPVVIVDLT